MAKIYRGIFTNSQVNYTDNTGNEQDVFVNIREIPTQLPYNLHVTIDDSIGDGNELVTLYWDNIPSGTTSIKFSYAPAGTTLWTDETIMSPDASGFYQITIPIGNYDFKIEIKAPLAVETYYIYADFYIDLEMADNPVIIRTVDNDEDKFTSIRSKAAEIRVHTNNDVNVMTFGGGGDNQYQVTISVGTESNIIFTGWLSISDLSQTFLPDPNVLVLTATDGLGFLKDVPLTDFNGAVPEYHHKLIEYITWCLANTGLQLDLAVEMNLIEKYADPSLTDETFYNYVYLNALTFETDINEREDCYTVLAKILGEFCWISQQKNVWYIRSIDEIGQNTSKVTLFDYRGNPIEKRDEENVIKYIGSDSSLYDMAFMNDDAQLSLLRPYKYVKHTYNYEYPKELVCNIDFSRGTAYQEPDFESPTSEGIYDPECWSFAAGNDGLDGTWWDSLPQAGSYGRIYKQFDYGYETDRFVKIQHLNVSGADYVHYLKSTAVKVKKGDKIKISVDVGQDVTLTSVNPVHVRLEPFDGTKVYDWNFDSTLINSSGNYVTNEWVEKNRLPSLLIADNPLSTTWRMDLQTVNAGDDIPKWSSISGEIEVPYDGFINIRLLTNFNIFVPYYFSNLNVEVITKINGSYQKFTGQQHLSEQDVDNKASREQQIYVTDAPGDNMKGALQKLTGTQQIYSGEMIFSNYGNFTVSGYHLPIFSEGMKIAINGTGNNGVFTITAVQYNSTPNVTSIDIDTNTTAETADGTISILLYGPTEGFYSVLKYPSGDAPAIDIIPYGQHQNQAVWNQFNRVFTAFEGNIDGLETDQLDAYYRGNMPDLLHTYELKDEHPATTNKRFMLLHYEENADLCEWGMYVQEVTDSTIEKNYEGHTFKYIQQ